MDAFFGSAIGRLIRGSVSRVRTISGSERFGAAVVLCMVLAALFAPVLAPYDPDAIDLEHRLEGPTLRNPMGQDYLGRDILSRVIYGARVSLVVAVSVVSVSLVVGIALGLTSGLGPGIVDSLIMRTVDVLLAFPGILLAIALVGIAGPSLRNVILVLAALGWVGYARLVRGQVLSIRERAYVMAARALGASKARLAIRHVLPNVLAPVLVEATFGLAGVILAEASLSFLGLGPQDVPSWGQMLSQGTDYLLFAPHMSIFPGLAIFLSVLAFNLLGDALRDRLDPRLKESVG